MKYDHTVSIYCVRVTECFVIGSGDVCREYIVLKCSHCGNFVSTKVQYVFVML